MSEHSTLVKASKYSDVKKSQKYNPYMKINWFKSENDKWGFGEKPQWIKYQHCDSAPFSYFPIFLKHDSLVTLMNRWIKLFPNEADDFKRQMEIMRKCQDKDNAMSANDRIMALNSMPVPLYYGMMCIDGDYWKDPKNLRRVSRAFKKLSYRRKDQ